MEGARSRATGCGGPPRQSPRRPFQRELENGQGGSAGKARRPAATAPQGPDDRFFNRFPGLPVLAPGVSYGPRRSANLTEAARSGAQRASEADG
jgi:hypothetical protein